MESLAPHERKFLDGLELPNNAQIFDVGANVGQFAVACLELWPEAFITCFEPGEGSFQDLASNTRPWEDNLSLRKCALGASRDLATFYSGGGGDQTASLYKRWLPEVGYLHETSYMVDVYTLSEMFEAPIDLLKIDAEGAELAVLQGARLSLNPHDIKRIYFEFNSCALDSRIYLRDFWRLLVEENGYGLSQVESDGSLSPIFEYDPELEDFAAHREFLAE